MQNTTKPKTINRRTAIKTGAAASVAAMAPVGSVDAELLGMWSRYQTMEAEIERLLDTVEKTRKHYPDLETMPAVVVPHNAARTVSEWKTDPTVTEEMRSVAAIKGMFVACAPVDCIDALNSYRDKLIIELESRIKARAALMEKSGIKAMNERIEALDNASYRICETIHGTPAHTVEGLAVKLRALVRLGRGMEDYTVDQLQDVVLPNVERLSGGAA